MSTKSCAVVHLHVLVRHSALSDAFLSRLTFSCSFAQLWGWQTHKTALYQFWPDMRTYFAMQFGYTEQEAKELPMYNDPNLSDIELEWCPYLNWCAKPSKKSRRLGLFPFWGMWKSLDFERIWSRVHHWVHHEKMNGGWKAIRDPAQSKKESRSSSFGKSRNDELLLQKCW